MATFARAVGGVVVETIDTDMAIETLFPPGYGFLPCPADVAQGWLYAAGSFTAPPPPVPPVVVPTVSALQFLGLFTADEQAAVFTAAPRDPALLGFLFQLACAGSVQLTDPRVVAGVNLLGMGGLVAASRPAQVLGNVAADAVSFDPARAVESGPVLADAVAFDTAHSTET